MKRTIVEAFCDICGKKASHEVNTPVMFTTEQNEGYPCEPYLSYEKLDLCKKCMDQIVIVRARGAQGHNKYSFK